MSLASSAIIFALRPYVSRELPAWGKVLHAVAGWRRDWFWANAGSRTICERVTGRLMRLDLSQWSDRFTFFLGRWYDLECQIVIQRTVRPGDTVVDVGANRGMFSFLASQRVGAQGTVISFEPNPHCVKILQAEATANGIQNIEVHTCGLGDTNGTLPLFVPTVNSGEATFAKSRYADAKQIVVPVHIGDNLLATISPSLIKIDVEGFECRVLRGLRRTIERSRPIVLTEVISDNLNAAGSTVEELTTLMRTMDYKGFALHLKRQGRKHVLTLRDFNRGPFNDAIWLHHSRLSEFRPGRSGIINCPV